MAARMEIVKLPGQDVQSLEIFGHHSGSEFIEARICCAGIHGIGCMAEKRGELVFIQYCLQPCDVLEVDRAGLAAARIACEKLERVGVNTEGFLAHVCKTFGNGKMAADFEHGVLLSGLIFISLACFNVGVQSDVLREIISYGYEISRQIREKTSDGYVIRETTLYSVFARLENAGYIESYSGSVSMGRPRTYYRITDAGRTYYRQKCQEWQEIQDLLQPFIEEE